MYGVIEQLANRRHLNLWRKREIRPNNTLCFRTNDYLGLAKHPSVVVAFKSALDFYGVGSQGAAVLGGYSPEHQKLEQALAKFTGCERALLFSTGYMANLAVITTLVKQLSITDVYSDRLNHASINDGILLSQVKFHRFPHRNYTYLKSLLAKNIDAKKLCLSEGVFGVDGDVAQLPELLDLCRHHHSLLIIDDAHGFGVMGENGRGTFEHYDLAPNAIPLMIGTFGKALGTFGAFVAGKEEYIELLIQYARPYIFTTALPPGLVACTLASLQIVQSESWRRGYLNKLISYFRDRAQALGIILQPSATPIQLMLTYDPETTLKCFDWLKQKGFWVGALRPPTVPEGHCRLRINLSVSHSISDIDALLESLQCIQCFIKKS